MIRCVCDVDIIVYERRMMTGADTSQNIQVQITLFVLSRPISDPLSGF